MPGCKIGDLARFLPPNRNVGRLVEVIGLSEYTCPTHGLRWVVQSLEPVWVRDFGHSGVWRQKLGKINACDETLQPLRPGDLAGRDSRDILVPTLTTQPGDW